MAKRGRHTFCPSRAPIVAVDIERQFGLRRDDHWINKNVWTPQGAARVLVVGPSDSGKTNAVLHMLMNHMHFDQFWIFTKNPDEAKYRLMKKVYCWSTVDEDEDACEEVPDFILSSSLEDVPNVEDIDCDKQTVILFDDMITEQQSKQKKIKELFVRGRKTNTQIYYLGQDFFKVPMLIRENSNYFMIFRPTSSRKIRAMADTFGTDVDLPLFRKLLLVATRPKFSFLFVDMDHPEKKYRCGFHRLLLGRLR